MTYYSVCFAILLAFASNYPITASAQSDELREVTGLPFSVDQPVIYGQVTFRGLSSTDNRPTVHVSLLVGGSSVERMKADDRGYFYFLRTPRNGSVLLFEVNEVEVGRQVLMAGSGARLRQDLEINWPAYRKSAQSKTVSVTSIYERISKNEKLFAIGTAALNKKKNSDAAQAFKQIVDSDPKDFVAWTELGTAYFNEGKISDADAAYEKALDLMPEYIVALINRGKLQLVQNNFENAIATFSSAVKADPANADAYHYLGESYLRIKLGSKAVAPLNEAIRLAPIEKADLHLRLAALYNAAGAKDKAAAEYKLFLQKMPNHPDKDKLTKYINENIK